MAVPVLWRQAMKLADFYREMARGQRDPVKKSILRLASTVLEDLSDELTYGYVRSVTKRKLLYVKELLESSHLPHYSLDKLIERVGSRYSIATHVEEANSSRAYEYLLGLA